MGERHGDCGRVTVKLWVGLVLLVAGAGALAVAAFEGYATRQFIRSALRADGTVVALYAGPAHPEVEYADASGQRHTFPGTGMVHHQAGARVGVLYIDRGDHHDARLAEWGSLWFSVCTTAGIGVALLIAGAYQIVSR